MALGGDVSETKCGGLKRIESQTVCNVSEYIYSSEQHQHSCQNT